MKLTSKEQGLWANGVPTYKNHTQLCRDHRYPHVSLSKQNIVDIIDQFHTLIYKQWDKRTKRRDKNYERVLDQMAQKFKGAQSMTDLELSTALEQMIDYIKLDILGHLEDVCPGYTLAPHIVLRSYNLFKSLHRSLLIEIGGFENVSQQK